jgi:hypothetical protein
VAKNKTHRKKIDLSFNFGFNAKPKKGKAAKAKKPQRSGGKKSPTWQQYTGS